MKIEHDPQGAEPRRRQPSRQAAEHTEPTSEAAQATGAQGRGPGRPEEKVWPEPIDASPEDVARALMQGPPKKDWRYLREAAARGEKQARD